jgi:hypothetical protein
MDATLDTNVSLKAAMARLTLAHHNGNMFALTVYEAAALALHDADETTADQACACAISQMCSMSPCGVLTQWMLAPTARRRSVVAMMRNVPWLADARPVTMGRLARWKIPVSVRASTKRRSSINRASVNFGIAGDGRVCRTARGQLLHLATRVPLIERMLVFSYVVAVPASGPPMAVGRVAMDTNRVPLTALTSLGWEKLPDTLGSTRGLDANHRDVWCCGAWLLGCIPGVLVVSYLRSDSKRYKFVLAPAADVRIGLSLLDDMPRATQHVRDHWTAWITDTATTFDFPNMAHDLTLAHRMLVLHVLCDALGTTREAAVAAVVAKALLRLRRAVAAAAGRPAATESKPQPADGILHVDNMFLCASQDPDAIAPDIDALLACYDNIAIPQHDVISI